MTLTVLKSIVACLTLANVGYFLWLHGIAASHAVPASQPPTATLELATEVPPVLNPTPADAGTPVAGADAAAANAAATTVPVAGAERCVSVGPFKDVSAAARAASTLKVGGHDPRQRVVDGEVWAGLWVYLPMPATRAASDQMLTKLKAAGIDDSLEMPGPADGSVLSLGLFSDDKRAQARVAQLQALGLNPGVADRKRTGTLYWIDLNLKPTDVPLNLAELQGDASHINRLEIKECPTPTSTPVAASPAP